jgi:hypothetical protein
MHSHKFKGVTTYVDGHVHLFSGVSSMSPDVPGHTHTIEGQTTVDDGHSHGFYIITQGPTKVDSKAHYHYYEGNTNIVRNHKHFITETTFVYGE